MKKGKRRAKGKDWRSLKSQVSPWGHICLLEEQEARTLPIKSPDLQVPLGEKANSSPTFSSSSSSVWFCQTERTCQIPSEVTFRTAMESLVSTVLFFLGKDLRLPHFPKIFMDLWLDAGFSLLHSYILFSSVRENHYQTVESNKSSEHIILGVFWGPDEYNNQEGTDRNTQFYA